MKSYVDLPVIGLGCLLVLAGCGKSSPAVASNLPDLMIQEVNVVEGMGPSDSFPYQEYWANVRVRNEGAAFESDAVFLNAGDDQVNLKVVNNGDKLSLGSEKTVDISYQILKNDLHSGSFVLQIDAGDNREAQKNGGNVEEYDEENNFYTLQIL